MSKNSPGVCISGMSSNSIIFHSFIRGEGNKKEKIHRQKLKDVGVLITVNNNHAPKNMEYIESENWKIEDAVLLSRSIVNSLPDDVDLIGMEGFSYNSRGNSGLDIAGYAYCVRQALYDRYGKDKIAIFSPGNVKKEAGKGNAGKEQMMEFFMQCEHMRIHPFWEALNTGSIDKNMKPVDDLCDSYFVNRCATKLYIKNNFNLPGIDIYGNNITNLEQK